MRDIVIESMLEEIKEDRPDRVEESALGRPRRNMGSPSGFRRRINQGPIKALSS